MNRIALIRRSLTAFVCGLVGLVPVLGMPFGAAAIVLFVTVRRSKGTEWNPAESYLDRAVVLALIGLILTLVSSAIAASIAISQLY